MSIFDNILSTYNNAIILTVLALLLISIIWNVIITIKLSSLSRKYKKFMRGSSGKNFETMLTDQIGSIESAIERVNIMNDDLVSMKNQVDKCIQKCNIIRYNAFSDTGSDLSFSIAMLDNFNDGFLITGIYGRNESFTYAKPVIKGTSKYPLSVEEEMVLNRSIKSKTNV
ncbi:MAG: DUF4446 family protein [Caulobacteraceae bacterium]